MGTATVQAVYIDKDGILDVITSVRVAEHS
jgi:hypothetical protein